MLKEFRVNIVIEFFIKYEFRKLLELRFQTKTCLYISHFNS
jgi:hypothetical protein